MCVCERDRLCVALVASFGVCRQNNKEIRGGAKRAAAVAHSNLSMHL